MNQNTYNLKKQSWQKIINFCFFNVATEEKLRYVVFLLQLDLFFFLLYVILMDTSKVTEYNPICKVFTEVF